MPLAGSPVEQEGVSLHPERSRAWREAQGVIFFCFLFFSQEEGKLSGAGLKQQRSLISFSLPCASPGAGLYFLFSLVIISMSHLVIKTLKEIISVFIQTLCLERHFVPIQRDRYFYII